MVFRVQDTILYVALTNADPFEQSGIKQSFTTNTPGVLMLDWNYLGDDAGFDAPVFVLDDTVVSLDPGFSFLPWIGGRPARSSSSPTVFYNETGYQRAVVQVEAGTHTFKDPAIGNRMINARAETLAEKPAPPVFTHYHQSD
jgi:hypothetical protein